MELNMQYIYQVYQDGSFTKASEKLYLTQPALSMAVRQEEKRLGAALFDRSRRPLTLTPAGEAYIRAAERVKYLESDLGRELDDLRDIRTGCLHVGGTHYLNCFLLAELLAGFSQRYPGVRLEVSEDSSVRLARRLERREMDLIFSCAPDLIGRFEHKPAFYDHVLLAVPQSVPVPEELAQCAMSAGDVQAGRHLPPVRPRVPLERFRDLEFILLQKGNNLYDRSTRMFDEAGFKPKVKLSLSQLVTAYRFADNGVGATFVSDRIVQKAPSQNLVFYAIESKEVDRLFYSLLPQRNYTAHAVKAFIAYAVEQLGTNDDTRRPL
ncbi:MAG: LysR family transcriptional regulator [Angelakisella sp.]|nr:LysR family transcriptional regulator [Angelakisella sp.]